MLYQPVPAGLAGLSVPVSVGATVSCLTPVTSAVLAEALPATSVTVTPACDSPEPSAKVNAAGAVTPEVAAVGVGEVFAAPGALLYQPVPAGLLIDWVNVGATVSCWMSVTAAGLDEGVTAHTL